jgi:hypothetical protein
MLTSKLLISLTLLLMLCAGCSGAETQAGPSPALQVSGTYTLAVTTCTLPSMNNLEHLPSGPYQTSWTIEQQDDVVTGRYSGGSPPAVSFGTLTGRPLFGGVGSGELQSCAGTGMPFRFTKRD